MPPFIRPQRPSWPGSRGGNRDGNGDRDLREARRSRQPSAGRRGISVLNLRDDDLRQQTLTQIDFVRRTPFPPVELELETIESEDEATERQQTYQPRKRRRIQTEVEASTSTSKFSPGKTGTLLTPKAVPSPAESHQAVKDATTHDWGSHEGATSMGPPSVPRPVVQNPQTPTRRRRTVVPSSQSPDTTPLSIRTGRSSRVEQLRSPLSQRRDTNVLLRASPSKLKDNDAPKLLRRTTIPETQQNEDSGGLTLAEDSEDTNGSLQPLRFDSPDPSQPAAEDTTSRLEASPNVPIHGMAGPAIHKRAGTRLPAEMPPPLVTPSQRALPSSQAPTQEPTQITASMAAAYRPDPRPSSQITTQDPTQLPDSRPSPPLPPLLRPATRIKTEQPTQSSGFERRPGVTQARVHSSQATTVLPSSGSPAPSPQPERPRTADRIKREEDDDAPLADPFSPVKAQNRSYKWDGKELTDSQLLPDTLINWSIPFPSSLPSEMSASEDEGDQITPRVTRARKPEKTPAAKAKMKATRAPVGTNRIKDEPASDNERTSTPISKTGRNKRQQRDKVDRPARVKDEPLD